MGLMPVSQAIFGALLLQVQSGHQDLRQLVAYAATFYCSWAVKNRLTTQKYERGYYSFGMAACGSLYALRGGTHAAAFVGALAIVLNFLVAAPRVLGWPAAKLAHVAKKTTTWAYVMKAYFLSSFLTWGAAALWLFRLWKMDRERLG